MTKQSIIEFDKSIFWNLFEVIYIFIKKSSTIIYDSVLLYLWQCASNLKESSYKYLL